MGLATSQESKFVPVIIPQAIVDNAYWSGSHQHGSVKTNIDCRGFKNASIKFWLGATDIAVAELSLYESDTTTDGDFVIVAASNYATLPLTLPSATADGTAVEWNVDLRKRKRYLRVNAKGGDGSTGAYAVAWADLWAAEQVPNSATERGLAQQVLL